MIAGNVTLEWAALDLFGHDLTYSVYYSANEGITWSLIKTGINTTYYVWDTMTVGDGSHYLIRINASCTEGKWNSFTSDATFTVDNHRHLQQFTLISPVGGEAYFGLVNIEWFPAEDIFNHITTYTVSYSPDNGTTWVTLASHLTTTSHIWDSTTVADGSQYFIQVNASCSEGSWCVVSLNASFTVDNVPSPTSVPSTQSTNSFGQSVSPLDLLPILQILGPVALLLFVVTMVIIFRKQRIT
jgi:hypothetical protein